MPKSKLTPAQKIAKLQRKADRFMQMWGRDTYSKCEYCSAPMTCLHHFFPKSTSSALRYDDRNLIPICQGCHMKHHNGDPRIHSKIIRKRGWKWHDEIEYIKDNKIMPYKGKKYYLDIIEDYERRRDSKAS